MSNPFAPSEVEPHPAPPEGAYLPNGTRALVLQWLLRASVAFDGLSIAVGWAGTEGEGAAAVVVGLAGLAVALGQSLGYVATTVAWLIWEYRAYKNLTALGAASLAHTPGGAIVWWFVPFANLVRPLHVMTEIWEVSAAQAKDRPGPDLLITVWWTAWVASNLASNLILRVYGLEDSPAAQTAWMFANALSVAAGVLALNVVRSIDEAQAAAAAERGFRH